MVRTLTNAFATGRIAQAWMLTGVRGVGKTTTARILARALNYKTATVDQPSIELAEIGEHCRAIMEGRHVDVIEMDAASHTGIDDIRDIIERVRYAPVAARYKVYIIDEVHMLSTQAFNGLLKTLEEPPPHVKFIFATTEIRKVPITVLSRCQRFDLRRVDAELLIGHLSKIAGLETVEVDDASLAMIARAAEGSVRDWLSIFDQAIAHGSGKVTRRRGAPDARARRPRPRRRSVRASDEGRCGRRARRVPRAIRRRRRPGDDPHRPRRVHASRHTAAFCPQRCGRCLAFGRGAPARRCLLAIAVAAGAVAHLADAAKGIPEVQEANRPVSAGEMVLIRIAHAANLPTLDEALKSLEDGVARPTAVPPPARPRHRPAPATGLRLCRPCPKPGLSSAAVPARQCALSKPGCCPRLKSCRAEPQPAVETVPVTSLADIAALADTYRDMTFKVLLKRCVRLVRIEPGRLDVSLTGDAPKSLLGDLTVKLKAWTGRSWMVSLSREEGGQTLAEVEAGKRETALLDARNDPAVAAILARFPGARVIDVRIPDAPEAEATEAAVPPDSGAEDDATDQ